tara:strand:+ start:485 stop:595 length:111 start_codon:yes stop_codon:yes gene_type:complete
MFLGKNRNFGMENASLYVTETGHFDHNILTNVKVMI